MPNKIASKIAEWSALPDVLLLTIFSDLHPRSLLRASQVCRQWYRVALDEFLWKDLLMRRYKPHPDCAYLAPDATSWLSEFKRLHYHTPVYESEVLKEHRDQVLHVCFSHDGRYFTTSSKDGFVKVWELGNPTYVKYYEDMKSYNWRYTQYTQFNESDTLLLVSGVHFGPHSTSGEIAVFNMQNGFALECTVRNKPYDMFGTWYNDRHLLSGNLHWLGNFSSCSVVYLNKSSQDLENIYESVVMQLFKFHNTNASSVRTIMIANRVHPEDFENDSKTLIQRKRNYIASQVDVEADSVAMDTEPDMECDSSVINSRDMASANEIGRCLKCDQSGDNMSCDCWSRDDGQISHDVNKTNENEYWVDKNKFDSEQAENNKTSESKTKHTSQKLIMDDSPSLNLLQPMAEGGVDHVTGTELETGLNIDITDSHPLPCRFGRGGECSNSVVCPPTVRPKKRGVPFEINEDPSLTCDFGASISTKSSSPKTNCGPEPEGDKYLIFTTGTRTFTPHQIGIKLIRHEEALGKMSRQAEYRQLHEQRVKQALHGHHDVNNDDTSDDEADDLELQMDTVDHLIEMDGHIIGMCLSNDHRYLYVNTRAWPKNYHIDDPLEPPPIAQQIEIHVIDLCTMTDLGTMHSAHKAFTPNDECFFIFLDVCEKYVASGAEDKLGYLWDRHYRMLLNTYKHSDVVNSVAFHPKDPETLVSVSDDNTVKVWRSRHRCQELGLPSRADLEREQAALDSTRDSVGGCIPTTVQFETEDVEQGEGEMNGEGFVHEGQGHVNEGHVHEWQGHVNEGHVQEAQGHINEGHVHEGQGHVNEGHVQEDQGYVNEDHVHEAQGHLEAVEGHVLDVQCVENNQL